MSIGYYVSKLLRKARLKSLRDCRLHASARVGAGSNLIHVALGRFSYTGYDCTIVNCSVGAFTSIGANCVIGGAGHPVDWVSTSPVFCRGRNILGENLASLEYNPYSDTLIGNDVWLGSNVIVLAGRSIGDGAVVGAGSVVTKNIPAYEIWAGNPAKLIRKRFPEATIARLLEIEWYNWELEKIEEHASSFADVDLFLSQAKRS